MCTGLEIGFEKSDINIGEEAGTVEICVKIVFPKDNVPIQDVTLEASPLYIGEASKQYQLTL